MAEITVFDMEDSKLTGKAMTLYPVHNLIRSRRSTKSFSDQDISASEINTILEAAAWAPSSMNEQPWEYIYAHKNTDGFTQILECLNEGNQTWAQKASVLIVSLAKNRSNRNQKMNFWAAHDVGMANANLLLQAVSMDIYGRIMGGFIKDSLINKFNLHVDKIPVCVIALGYRTDPESMDHNTRAFEFSERHRKPVTEYAQKLA